MSTYEHGSAMKKVIGILKRSSFVTTAVVGWDDLVQEGLIAAWRHRDKPSSYLSKRIRGAIADGLRNSYLGGRNKSFKQPKVVALEDPLDPSCPIERTRLTGTDNVDSKDLASRLMNGLNPYEREVVRRNIYNDETLTEIARSRGVTLSAVSLTKKKALTKLRKVARNEQLSARSARF